MAIVNRHMNRGLKVVFEPIIITDMKSINHIIKQFLSLGVVFLLAFLINSCYTGKKAKKFGIEEEAGVPTGLQVNNNAPDFKGKTQKDKTIRLSSLLKQQPVVLFFYRGYWCPVCNDYLKDYQDSLNMITDKGIAVVAVTPETSENVSKTRDKTGAAFTIISDSTGRIMEKYEVKFKVTKGYQRMVKAGLFTDVAASNDQEEAYLPVPATYLINKNGIIEWKQFDTNYKNRASVKDILQAIEENNL